MNKLSLHHLHGLAGFCPVSGSPLPDDPHTRFYSQLQSVTGQVTSGITHHCHWDPILMATPERIRGLVRHLRRCHLDPPKKTVAFLRGMHWTGFFFDTRTLSGSRLDCMKCFVVEILCCYLFCCHVYSTSIFHLTLFTLTCFDFTDIYLIQPGIMQYQLSYFGGSAKTPGSHWVKESVPRFYEGNPNLTLTNWFSPVFPGTPPRCHQHQAVGHVFAIQSLQWRPTLMRFKPYKGPGALDNFHFETGLKMVKGW